MKALISPDAFPTAQQYTYLNAASIALMPQIVAEAAVGWQREFGMLGTVHLDEESEAKVFDALRQAGARLLGAQPDEIACGSNASELLCSLAWALSPGPQANVVSAQVEFPSVVYPWLRVAQLTGCDVRLASDRDHLVDPSELLDLIDDRTSAVCISHVQYSTGQRLDLAALAQVCHTHGAILIVDATQSAGAVPIDVAADDIDVLVTSGYKWLCAPLGSAIIFVRRDLHGDFEPGLVGWRSTEQIGLHFEADHIAWASSARRFEFGTIAYGLTLGLAEFLSPSADSLHSSIVTVRFPGHDQGQVARRLNEEGVVVSPRIGGIRISPHLYNSAADVDRALETAQGILGEAKS
jgi:selenocysteine lyase/cysteine desulfurase